MNNYYMPM